MDARPTTTRSLSRVPTLVVGSLALAVVLASAGLVSCRSGSGSGSPGRPPIPPDPELVRVPAGAGIEAEPLLVAPVPISEPDVRVRVLAGVGGALVEAGAIAELVDDRGRTWRVMTPARVERTPTGFVVRAVGRASANAVEIESRTLRLMGGTVDGALLPGRIDFVERAGGSSSEGPAFDVIAELPLEVYVTGVVQREVFPHWPAEALRAQAVAARSYALHTRALSRAAARGHDLESTTVDQAFAGVGTDPRVVDAVRATRGRVLAFESQVLRAYYHSTSGGRSAGAAEVWPTGPGFEYNRVAPLQAGLDAGTRVHASDDSPSHRWSRDRGRERLSLRIRRFGEEQGRATKNLRTLATVETTERNATGRPVRYRLVDVNGESAELSAEELRLACNWPVPGVPGVTRATRVRSGDLSVRFSGSRALIEGRGFGHGVGMCQYSAAGLARDGWTHADILHNFYPGATLLDAYP